MTMLKNSENLCEIGYLLPKYIPKSYLSLLMVSLSLRFENVRFKNNDSKMCDFFFKMQLSVS
jgi:hypothetical protein